MEIVSNASSATTTGGGGRVPSTGSPQHYEMEPLRGGGAGGSRTPTHPLQQHPKSLTLVTSNNGISHALSDPEQYPDLLNIHPRPQAGGGGGGGVVVSPAHSAVTAKPANSAGQPLNPAALVVPPAPPAQFPHQFPHLIHTNKSAPRAHSPPRTTVPVSPLLSPPAQFSSDSPVSPKHAAGHAKGYVTLPRRLTGTAANVVWEHQHQPPPSRRAPVYDGVGPRTSATGSCTAANDPSPKGCPCPTIPELDEHIISSKKRSSSLKRPGVSAASNREDGKRDSSGSEVTLGGEDSITAYCEPFGRSLPPLTSNNYKNNTAKRPDSIASTDSDLEAILGREPSLSNSSCPVHKHSHGGGGGHHFGGHPKIINIPKDNAPDPVVQVQKAAKPIKGILKGGSMSGGGPGGGGGGQNKGATITTNPMASNVTNVKTGNGTRESSCTTSTSGGSPPPLADIHISSTNHHSTRPTAGNSNSGKPPVPANKPKPPVRTTSAKGSGGISEALNV